MRIKKIKINTNEQKNNNNFEREFNKHMFLFANYYSWFIVHIFSKITAYNYLKPKLYSKAFPTTPYKPFYLFSRECRYTPTHKIFYINA